LEVAVLIDDTRTGIAGFRQAWSNLSSIVDQDFQPVLSASWQVKRVANRFKDWMQLS